jgi:hypothetical protein
MQESAQVKSSDCGNLVAIAVDERNGEVEEGKEEGKQEGGASGFIKMRLAWRQRSPLGFEKSGRAPRMFYTLLGYPHRGHLQAQL